MKAIFADEIRVGDVIVLSRHVHVRVTQVHVPPAGNVQVWYRIDGVDFDGPAEFNQNRIVGLVHRPKSEDEREAALAEATRLLGQAKREVGSYAPFSVDTTVFAALIDTLLDYELSRDPS